MAAVGSLLVRIGADTGGLTKGGRRAESTMQRMGREAKNASKRVAKLGAAAAAAGIAITAELTRRGLNAVDAMTKLGRQLGETQATMAGLTRAASDAGIEQGKLRSNVQALNKRLGEAKTGTGRAADTLDRLGLSADELSRMPLAERLDVIGASINNLDTQADKASATADIFSRSGLDMMNLFEQGKGSIAAATQEMRDFGVAVDQTDAEAIERANDAMSRIGDIIQGISNQLAVQFAPLLEAASKHFTTMAREAGGMGNAVENAFNKGTNAAIFLVNAVDGVRMVFELAGKGVAWFAAMAVKNFLWAADAVINGPIKAVNELISVFNKIPGIDIEPVGMSGLGNRIAEQYKIATGAVMAAEQDISDTISKPLAGERLRAFIEEAKAGAEELSSVAQNMATGDGQEGVGDGTDKKSLEKKLERIREANMSEIELMREKHELELEEINRAKEAQLINKQEWDALMEDTEKRHQAEITKAVQSGLSQREKFERASMMNRVKTVGSHLQQMTQSVAGENKKMFEINKAASIATAIVDAYKGISRTLSEYPYPLNLGMAAAHAVAAFAQISSIKSQSFSGGGSTAPSATPAGSGAAAGSTPTHSGGGQEQVSRSITIRGEGVSQAWIRDSLAPALSEAAGDGVKFSG